MRQYPTHKDQERLTKMHLRKTNENGFTIFELVAVMLIIGVLSAVAIPVFLSQRNKAAEYGAKISLGKVYNSEQIVKNSTGSYVDGKTLLKKDTNLNFYPYVKVYIVQDSNKACMFSTYDGYESKKNQNKTSLKLGLDNKVIYYVADNGKIQKAGDGKNGCLDKVESLPKSYLAADQKGNAVFAQTN